MVEQVKAKPRCVGSHRGIHHCRYAVRIYCGRISIISLGLIWHTSSKRYESAVDKERLLKTASIGTAVNHIVISNEEGVLCSKRTAYFMAKKNLAISKHSALMELLKIQECSAAGSTQFLYSYTESPAESHKALSKTSFCQGSTSAHS